MASISIKNLAQAIYDSTKDLEGSNLDKMIDKNVVFLKNKNLIGKKEEILKALQKIVDKENHTINAKISVGSKIKTEHKKELEEFIKKKYKAKEVTLEIKEDSKLLGGMKIEIGDDIIDGTLLGKINQLQTYLIKN